jgi:hypothetical protein
VGTWTLISSRPLVLHHVIGIFDGRGGLCSLPFTKCNRDLWVQFGSCPPSSILNYPIRSVLVVLFLPRTLVVSALDIIQQYKQWPPREASSGNLFPFLLTPVGRYLLTYLVSRVNKCTPCRFRGSSRFHITRNSANHLNATAMPLYLLYLTITVQSQVKQHVSIVTRFFNL